MYAVTYNDAGYLPEPESVWEYDTLAEAWAAAGLDYLDRLENRLEEDKRVEEYTEDIRRINVAKDALKEGSVQVQNPDNASMVLVYTVEEV